MKTLLLFISITCVNHAVSQTTKCIPKTDSNEVVRIAKKKNIYWTKNWQCRPVLKLDTLTCKWTLITGKIDHTNKGDCKYTNGCTVSTTATLVINAVTGKTLLLEKNKKLFHNYE